MKLNIVKGKKNNNEVVNIVKEVFSASEIALTNDYGETIDIEVKDNFVINRILKHLHLNIESQISLKKLANEVNLSEGYISDCFKKHMGITIMKYAKKIRIDRGKVLLVTTNSSISGS